MAADALSGNHLPRFMQVLPEAAQVPTPIPTRLVDLVVREQPDWTCPAGPNSSAPASVRPSPVDTANLCGRKEEIPVILPTDGGASAASV